MKKLYLCLYFLACCTQWGISQTQFQRIAGASGNDRNYHLTATPDGGLVGTGYTQSVSGKANEAFLIKYTRFGEIEWAKTYGGINNETTWDVISNANSEIISVGYTASIGTPNEAAIINKFDSTGSIIWSKAVHSSNGTVNFYRVIQTSTNHLLATGLSVSNGHEDILLCKFDANGNLVWSKKVGTPQNDEIMGMIETSEGNYLIAGLTQDANGNGGNEFAAVKLDTAGNVIWKKRYGSASSDRINSVLEVNNNYYFLGWSPAAGIGGDDFVLLNTDTAGNVNWIKAYGTPVADRAFNMLYDPSQNAILLAGYTDYSDTSTNNRNTLLVSVALNGNLNWAISYGSTQTDGHWPTGIAMNNDKGYYLQASSNTFVPGVYNIYLIKTDEHGNSACNQKSPAITTDTLNWTAANFGTDSFAILTLVNTNFVDSNWAITSTSLCCKLASDSLSNTVICPGDSALIQSQLIPAYQYQWTHATTTVSTSNHHQLMYGDSGLYYLHISVSDSSCPAILDSVSVLSDTMPNLGFANYYSFCPNDSINLSTSANFNHLQWYSYPQLILLAIGNSYTATATMNINLEVISTNNCVYTDSIYVYMLPNDSMPQLGFPAFIQYCPGDTFTISTATAVHSIDWFSLSKNQLIQSGTTFNAFENDSIELRITDLNSCLFFDTLLVNAIEKNYTGISDTAFCEEDTIYLQAPMHLPHFWLHDTSLTDKEIAVWQSGQYILQVQLQGCFFVDTATVVVHPLPPAPIITPSQYFQILTANLDSSLQWYFRGDPLPGETNKVLYTNDVGLYMVSFTDSNGCTSFSEEILAGIGSIDEFSKKEMLSLYPNPSTGEIQLLFKEQTQNMQLHIYNQLGALVYTEKMADAMEGKIHSVQLSHLPKSMYFVQLSTENKIESLRLILK
jgi:hypothetical protein